MAVVIVVAAAENGVIGAAGKIPWHIPEDLKRFKALTMGHRIVMGRKTWASIGRALPGRESVVVTRQAGFRAEGARVVASLDEALEGATGDVFVIGGGEIYREALPRADRVELTRVHAKVEGDVTFPALDPTAWREVAREPRSQTTPQPLAYDFVTYERA